MGMRSGDFSLPKAWGPKSAAAPATVVGEPKAKTPLGNREGGRTLRPESQETCRRERCYPARRAGRRDGHTKAYWPATHVVGDGPPSEAAPGQGTRSPRRRRSAMNRFLNRFCMLAMGAAMLAPAQALAHHVMGGKVPVTFMQGLLSGLGHPILGLDHFAAVVGVGILAALLGRGVRPVLAFSAAMIFGVALHLASANIPAAELLVGLSTILIGGLVALRRPLGCLPLGVFASPARILPRFALCEPILRA